MHKVLLVEDEVALLQVYADTFKNAGFEVVTAVDSESAITAAVQHKPDIILLDLMLPDTTGTITLQHLKKMTETKDIPVAIVSVLSEDVPKSLDSTDVFNKTIGYFRKDKYSPDQLVKEIQRFFTTKEFSKTFPI